jgi:hypothetical protein
MYHLQYYHQDDPEVALFMQDEAKKGRVFRNVPAKEEERGLKLTSYFSPQKTKCMLPEYQGSYSQDNLLLHIAFQACLNNISVNTLCSVPFINFIGWFSRQAKSTFPSRNQVRCFIDAKFIECRERYDAEIREVKGKVSLIVDGWTNRANRGFFAVMVCFLAEENKKKVVRQRLLRLIPSTRHTGNDLADLLIEYVDFLSSSLLFVTWLKYDFILII